MTQKNVLQNKIKIINQQCQLKGRKVKEINPLQAKIKHFKDKIGHYSKIYNQQIKELQKEANSILSIVQENNTYYQKEIDCQKSSLCTLNKWLHQKIEDQVKYNKEQQSRILSIVENKINKIILQIAQQRKIRNEIGQKIQQTLENDIQILQNKIESSCSNLNQQCQKLKQLQEKYSVMSQNKIEQFDVSQKKSQQSILKLIKSFEKVVKDELKKQRQITENTHEQLLNYVKQTCQKFNAT